MHLQLLHQPRESLGMKSRFRKERQGWGRQLWHGTPVTGVISLQVAPYVSQLRQFVKKRKAQQQKGKKKKDKDRSPPTAPPAAAPTSSDAQPAGTQSIEVYAHL